MSGGPEVFRRLVRDPSSLVETALQELTQEGVLKETLLRVGRIYHYPANTAIRLDVLTGFMKRMAEAPARGARAAHGADGEGAPSRPAREPTTEPASPRVAAPTSETAAAVGGEPKPFVPQRAVKRDRSTPLAASPDETGTVPEATTPAATVSTAEVEPKPFVPQRAAKRDPSQPLAVPRDPTSPTRPADPPADETTPSTPATATPAAPAGGEKKPFVPQKAIRRDPDQPRPVLRDGSAPQTLGPGESAPRPEERSDD
jgi:hypothetical protein